MKTTQSHPAPIDATGTAAATSSEASGDDAARRWAQNSEASGFQATALGEGLLANQDDATAVGNNAQATGIQGSAAFGDDSVASGAQSTALGQAARGKCRFRHGSRSGRNCKCD